MDFDFGSLFGGLVFSTIGLAAYRIGKNRSQPVTIGIGVLLIVLPWLIDGGVWLWVVGGLLTAAAFVL